MSLKTVKQSSPSVLLVGQPRNSSSSGSHLGMNHASPSSKYYYYTNKFQTPQHIHTIHRIHDDDDHFDNDDVNHHRRYVHNNNNNNTKHQYLYVLPVLFFEFAALALTRAVLPTLLLQQYGNQVYIVMGCTEFVRGLLAFITCPLFGKLSDTIGRRICLFITVLGTCAPVCSLALFDWETTIVTTILDDGSDNNNTIEPYAAVVEDINLQTSTSDNNNDNTWKFITDAIASAAAAGASSTHATVTVSNPYAIPLFIILLALSGIVSSTFTLTFAYISDTVPKQDERVSAYGLALATFGLSFTIGPMVGGYLAHTNPHYVFISSFFLTIIDLLYIYAILPESRIVQHVKKEQYDNDTSTVVTSGNSIISLITTHEISWNPFDSIQLILIDPFLRQVGKVAFLYYTALWALISTLSVYAVKQFHFSPNRLGELMSAIGLSTMLAEAVLVRIMVPMLGEKTSMKIGLLSFAIQCTILGFATEPWHLFICAGFSLLGNLVYPSLSSLVSGNVETHMVGEALGAINGIKALTEGFGPLLFGTLMTLSEHSILPGWPYLIAAVLVICAYKETQLLPDVDTDEYIHELDRKYQRRAAQQQQQQQHHQHHRDSRHPNNKSSNRRHHHHSTMDDDDDDNEIVNCVDTIVDVLSNNLSSSSTTQRLQHRNNDNENDDEVEALLSEVEESWDDDEDVTEYRTNLDGRPNDHHPTTITSSSTSSSSLSPPVLVTLGSLQP